ncbi:MAG: uracil-DNA glycosylase family protein [Gemmatimonadales bacterium]
MSDPAELFRRYLEQRPELLQGEIVLPRTVPQRRAERPRDGAAPQSPTLSGGAEPGPRRPARRAEVRGSGWRSGAPPIPPRGIVAEAPASDLFSDDPLSGKSLDEIAEIVHSCTLCALCESRTNAVPGEGPGDARLVVVGEGPGAVEDETGRPFVGRAGELLTDILAAIDLPRESVFICNVVKCRPPNNRKPQQDEIDRCVPYLYRQLEIIRPAVILAMGGTAAEALLGVRQSLGGLRNKVHEFRGTPLVVTYHPAALLRNPHWKKPTWDDVRIARQLIDQRR